MNAVFSWVFKTVVGRWVTASLVALLLSGGAWKFHAWKEDLIHKGQQVCVQEINKETVEQLQAALAAEKSARADLVAKLAAAAAANQEAINRRNEAEAKMRTLAEEMRTQRENDETYRAWSDSNLPDGVASRLRGEAAGSNPSPLRDD